MWSFIVYINSSLCSFSPIRLAIFAWNNKAWILLSKVQLKVSVHLFYSRIDCNLGRINLDGFRPDRALGRAKPWNLWSLIRLVKLKEPSAQSRIHHGIQKPIKNTKTRQESKNLLRRLLIVIFFAIIIAIIM